MEISDKLLCLYTGQIEERGDSYVLEVPEHEIEAGGITPDGRYRVAILPQLEKGTVASQGQPNRPGKNSAEHAPQPPVEEGEQREVEIENLGEQGDGIARVERGYVVIVPDTEIGDQVRVEITDVRQNLSFAEVIDETDPSA